MHEEKKVHHVKNKNLVEIKVVLSHPAKKFQLGRHSIGIEYQEYELNEAEKKELQSAGCKKWLEVKK
jgi:hypothetical protein